MELNMKPCREKSLIFIHIPKAAGVTFSSILDRQYKSYEVFTVHGSKVKESIGEFVNLPKEKRGRIRLLKGHMEFGLHKHFPHPSTYVTIMRNPVERTISHYYYVLQTPSHYLYDTVISNDMTIEEYVSSGISTELDNGQLRMIAGQAAGNDDIPFGKCSRVLLEKAQYNIRKYFAVLGVVEDFDETLVLIKQEMGWKGFPFYYKRNVTRRRPTQKSLPEGTIRTIEANNALDCELYEFAKKALEEKIRSQASFKTKFLIFLVLNSAYKQIAERRMLHSTLRKIRYL
ncbi:MAG TPA: hypothetical protein EYP19_15220 [Desulfobacterales bacterium]|nr:hypothetical protein [Desulfobacterales bacterium]